MLPNVFQRALSVDALQRVVVAMHMGQSAK
jgi:hypothetical protein